jgi:hypothetical protein
MYGVSSHRMLHSILHCAPTPCSFIRKHTLRGWGMLVGIYWVNRRGEDVNKRGGDTSCRVMLGTWRAGGLRGWQKQASLCPPTPPWISKPPRASHDVHLFAMHSQSEIRTATPYMCSMHQQFRGQGVADRSPTTAEPCYVSTSQSRQKQRHEFSVCKHCAYAPCHPQWADRVRANIPHSKANTVLRCNPFVFW